MENFRRASVAEVIAHGVTRILRKMGDDFCAIVVAKFSTHSLSVGTIRCAENIDLPATVFQICQKGEHYVSSLLADCSYHHFRLFISFTLPGLLHLGEAHICSGKLG